MTARVSSWLIPNLRFQHISSILKWLKFNQKIGVISSCSVLISKVIDIPSVSFYLNPTYIIILNYTLFLCIKPGKKLSLFHFFTWFFTRLKYEGIHIKKVGIWKIGVISSLFSSVIPSSVWPHLFLLFVWNEKSHLNKRG